MKLKICGMKYPPNIAAVAALAPDYLGFIFYPKSLRFAGDLQPITLEKLPKNIEKVGVFVNETADNLLQLANQFGFKNLQLHGTESPAFCAKLKEKGYTIFKAFHIENQADIEKIATYQTSIDFALLDTKGKQLGGNGTSFDWNLLQFYDFETPFLLSGGISLENIEAVLQIKHPKLYGIDVNSKFEIEAGLKNIEKLAALCHLLVGA
jgi:phosphoribosylanthranilate isomerase